MCQEAPGPRCWSDTCKTMSTYKKRLDKNGAQLRDVRASIAKIGSATDFGKYAGLREKERTLLADRVELMKDERHAQRDLDGTKTGRKKLLEELARASNDKERKALETRMRSAEAIRFCRESALKHKRNPRVPALFI